MAFFKTNKDLDASKGRVYLFEFILLDGTRVHKIGMCNSSRSTDRFMEVLRAFFNVYRYTPIARILRDKEVVTPRLVEKHLHSLASDYKYSFDNKFDGSTEFFIGLPIEEVKGYYTNFNYLDLLSGVTEMDKSDYDLIRSQLDREEDLGELNF